MKVKKIIGFWRDIRFSLVTDNFGTHVLHKVARTSVQSNGSFTLGNCQNSKRHLFYLQMLFKFRKIKRGKWMGKL